jgi:ATP-dependent exoDNAse (exonuclease V) beta subunit
VVLVVGLDWEVGARPRELRARFEGWEDPATLLERAGLHRIPQVACKEVQAALLVPHDAAARATERCLAYVAITRARDRLILEWPAWAKDLDGTLAGLLEEAGLRIENDAVTVGDVHHPARVIRPAEALPPGFEDEPVRSDPMPFPVPGRAEPCPPIGAELIRRPSAASAAGPLTGHARSVGLPLPSGDGADPRARGTALHLAMRVLLTRPDRVDALPAATGLDAGTLAALAFQAKGLRAALRADGLTELHAELPLDAHHADGTTTRGTIDLLATGAMGRAIVVDLKSPAPDDPMAATAAHAGQLTTYADGLRLVLTNIASVERGVLWMGSGVLALGE